jgi:hypothetical protein
LLQGENLSLLRQAQLIRDAVKHRFAGITLAGQRIVLLIDMSGSMALEDESTADPDKWPLLCESVGKIMRSMGNLEKFQVILFSNNVTYPLGRNGQWFDYEPEISSQKVVDTLKGIKPEGATNLYSGLAEAFRFRANGLDTIYLFSDGLPTDGPGLPANMKLDERQKNEYYSKHIRDTLRTLWNRPINGVPPVRINTIGFYFQSPDLGAFLWSVARDNDGSFVGMSKQ